MRVKERDRLVALRQIAAGERTVAEAARRLGLSRRQMRRLLRRFEVLGDAAVVHAARGRAPNNRKPAALRERVLERAREDPFHDFGPTLLAEHLSRDPEIGPLNPHTLRRWMIAHGRWQPRRHKPRHRQSRPRRPAAGELVLLDTSEHAWLEDRYDGPMALIASIDDAGSTLLGRFIERDNGEENRRFLIDYLEQIGRPRAFYVDRASHFGNVRLPRSGREAVDATAREPAATRSIIQRALEALDVELIFARSPQAKGRVERLFATLQDRLVKELRLAGIHSIEDANRHLQQTFLPFWSRTFTVPPLDPVDLHRPVPHDLNLLALFAETQTRVLARDCTLKFEGHKLQISATEADELRPGERITVESRLDGSTHFRHGDRYLNPKPVSVVPPVPAPRRKPPVNTPEPDHPWRRAATGGRARAS